MKAALVVAAGLAACGPAFAALPPQFEMARDLDAMVGYAKQHPKVIASLRTLDLQGKVILFGDDCRVEFARQVVQRPPGWAGPIAPLVFKSASCPVD